MLFDALTPDTSSYMVAGYVIFLIIAVIYIASLYFRARNLNRDLLTLENLRQEQEQEARSKTSKVGRQPPSRPRKSGNKSSSASKNQKKTSQKR